MENNGWIKLHRKLTDNPIFRNAELLQLFIYCLLKSNYEDREFLFNGELVKIQRGQFITGRKIIAKDLKQNENSVYTRLKLLEKLKYIKLISNNRFSILTVEKYETYQAIQIELQQQDNNSSTTSQQQDNTTKKDKELIKKEKNKTGGFLFEQIEFPETLNNEVFRESYKQWFDYLKEKRKGLTKIGSKQQLKSLAENSKDAVKMIERSISNGWIGIFALPLNSNPKNGTTNTGQSTQVRIPANSL